MGASSRGSFTNNRIQVHGIVTGKILSNLSSEQNLLKDAVLEPDTLCFALPGKGKSYRDLFFMLFYFIFFVSLREICILGAFVCLFAQSRMGWHAPVKEQKSSCKKILGQSSRFRGMGSGLLLAASGSKERNS